MMFLLGMICGLALSTLLAAGYIGWLCTSLASRDDEA